MMLLDAPEQLRCLWRHMRLGNLTEFQPRHNNEQSNLIAFALDVQTCKTAIKLKMLLTENLLNLFDVTTKQATTGSTWGTE